LSLPNYAVLLSSPHQLETLLGIFDNDFVESLDVNAILFVLMDGEFLFFCYFGVILE
jgi:hypothetical protein